MKRYKRQLLKNLLGLFLLVLLTFSCSENVFDGVTPKNDFNQLSAKLFFENNISDIKIPNLFTSRTGTRVEDFHSNDYRVNWDTFIYSENKSHYIYEFDLNTVGYNLFPALFTNENGSISYVEQDTKVKSSLVIMKSKTTDSFKIFVNTLIGYMINNKELCAFNEDKSDFRGFQIFTDCEGNYLPSGYLYQDKINKLDIKSYDESEYSQLPSIFFIVTRKVSLKAHEEQDGDAKGQCYLCGFNNGPAATTCFMCGAYLSSGDAGNPIGGGLCQTCGKRTCICDVCLRCKNDPCICPDPNERCIYCLSEEYAGECRL